MDRFIKQALLSKSDHNVSAALVSMIELFKKGSQSVEVIKRSINELQDKLVTATDGYVQY